MELPNQAADCFLAANLHYAGQMGKKKKTASSIEGLGVRQHPS